MDYRKLAKDELIPFFNGLVYSGLKNYDYEKFIKYIDSLSPDFLKNLGESIEIYNDGWHWSSISDLYTKLGKSANGNLPANRIELQQLETVLIQDLEDVSFTKLASSAVVDTAKDVSKGIATSASAIGSSLVNISGALPYIALIGIGLYFYLKHRG